MQHQSTEHGFTTTTTAAITTRPRLALLPSHPHEGAAPIFRDYALEALDRRERQGVRGIDSERNRFMNHICFAPFAKLRLDEIRRRDIRAWLHVMQDKKAADTRGDRLLCSETIKRAYSLVSTIFATAVDIEIIERSPCTELKLEKRSDENATREKWTWLTLDEQKLIVGCSAIPYMDRLMIRFAIGTGLRQGEQCNLELTDIHTGHDSPRVVVRYGSKGRLPTKNGKMREVPLFGDGLVAAKAWLLELATYAPENPYNLVFPTVRGRHRPVGKPLGAGGKLKRYLAFVGITRRTRWHDLRHSFCSSLVSGAWGRAWSLPEIRDAAGHSSVTQTERYAHLGPEAIAHAGRATTFTHEPLMPIVDAREAQPIDAEDFAAVDWDAAVAS